MQKSARPESEEAPWSLFENWVHVDSLLERWGYWARPRILYRRTRSAEGAWRSPQVFGLPDPCPAAIGLWPEEKYGWWVECAWRTLPDGEKWILSEWYIHCKRDAFAIRKACRKAGIPRSEHKSALLRAAQHAYERYLTQYVGTA